MPDVIQRAPGRTRPRDAPRALRGFVDSLVQSFENCRDGLSDDAVRTGKAEAWFRARYPPERDRLADVLRRDPDLGDEARAELFERVDRLIGEVLLPAYARLATRHTLGERNDFYRLEPRLHLLERVGFALAGLAVGGFAVWAPFIPLWEKEWVLPFLLAGLVWPELRRAWRVRRYQHELNRVVARADAEIGRIEVSTSPPPGPAGREETETAGSAGEGRDTWSRSQGSRPQPGS